MALAVQCYDLVESHLGDVSRSVKGLQEEIEARPWSPLPEP